MIIVIPGRFPGMNDFIDANRRKRKSWSGGNEMKQRDQRRIIHYLPHVRITKPVYIRYVFYEENRRRDKDNISSYFHKIFQDACVKAGVLRNDGWKEIVGFSDDFYVDAKNPRIEISLEVNENGKEG